MVFFVILVFFFMISLARIAFNECFNIILIKQELLLFIIN